MQSLFVYTVQKSGNQFVINNTLLYLSSYWALVFIFFPPPHHTISSLLFFSPLMIIYLNKSKNMLIAIDLHPPYEVLFLFVVRC